MTVSACVLVRNEGVLLRGCLESMARYVDEIVVADNASTDDSAAVARGFGARVISLPGSVMDEGRNACLEAATGDWILVLDADERICERGGAALHRVIAEAPRDMAGFNLPLLDYSGRGRWSEGPRLRLFRNNPDIRYTNSPIHATVGPSARAVGRIGKAHIPLHHLSALCKRADPAKTRRYISLIEERAEAHPILYSYVGLEYMLEDRQELAEGAFRKGVENAGATWVEYGWVARLFWATFLLRQGEISKARREAAALCELGTAFHRIEAALALMAEVCCQEGGRRAALACCRRALLYSPESPTMCLNMAALLEEQAPHEALSYLEQALERNPYLTKPVIYRQALSRHSGHMHVALLSCVRNTFDHGAACHRAMGNSGAAEAWVEKGQRAQQG